MSLPALPSTLVPGGRYGTWRPVPPRYVACDVDGTLVGPRHEATDEVVAAVSRAQAAGVAVGIATGRMGAAIEPLRAQLATTGPDVVFNGGAVVHGDDAVSSWSLTPAQVDGLLALVAERDDVCVEIYEPDAYHTSRWDERARPHWELLRREPRSVLRSATELGDATVPKATFVVFDAAALSTVIAGARALGLSVDAGAAGSPLTPERAYVNATHPDTDKGRALRHAAGHLGVPLDAVVAVGDAPNDLSMLAVAGTAIAMGQAPPAVRAAAHLVAPSVDRDGAAVVLDACAAWSAAAVA